MKDYVYKPEVNADSEFSGEVKIKIPSYKERLKIIKEMNFSFNSDGSLNTSNSSSQIDIASNFVDIVEKHVEEVKVKLNESDEEFNSIDDLGYCEEGTVLINELANLVISGIRLGKK